MKILFVCGAGYVSGREIITLAQAEGLRERGAEVSFVVSSWSNGDFINRLQSGRFPYTVLPIGFISKTLKPGPMLMTINQLLRFPILYTRFRCLCKRIRPDVIIHTNFHHAVLLAGLAKSGREYYIVHETLPEGSFYHRVLSYISKRLHSYIPVSDFVGRNLKGLGVGVNQIRVVKNGILVPGTLSKRPVESSNLTLGIVGQVVENKGHEDVLQALAILRKRLILPNLLIFGACAPAYRTKLNAMVAKLGLESQVEWCGFEQDQAKIYSRLDACLVLSRHHDPFPTSALEAAAHSMPVIASSQGGLPEIVVHGKTGFTCLPYDIEDIAGAIFKLFDSDLRRSLAEAARQRAEDHFQRSRMNNELHAFFSSAQ